MLLQSTWFCGTKTPKEIPLFQNLCSSEPGCSFFTGRVFVFFVLVLQMVNSPRSEKTAAMIKK